MYPDGNEDCEISNAAPDMYSFKERKKLEELRQTLVDGEQSGIYRNFDAKIFLEETKYKHGIEENKLGSGDSQTKKGVLLVMCQALSGLVTILMLRLIALSSICNVSA